MLEKFQRQLLYFPSHDDATGRGDGIFVPLRDKADAFVGYVKEPRHGVTRTLLFFHGNGGEALHRGWIAQAVPETVRIILAEYPGYGARTGEPSEKAIEQAALGAYEVATSRWREPVTVLGESLGSGAAAMIAKKHRVDRLALISPFTSVADVAKVHYPLLPVDMLLIDRFDSIGCLAKSEAPLRIIHGTADDIVPFELGKKLFDAYPGRDKQLIPLRGVRHNDIAGPIVAAPEAAGFRDFLAGK
jgi:pimeloyl-ACP methyl ester carboxylesterase